MKGLTCTILMGANGRDRCALYNQYQQVTLIGAGIAEVIEPSEDRPAVTLIKRTIGGSEYLHVVPCDENAKSLPGWFMASGQFIYSHDSRFPHKYPLALHDRQE